MYTGPELRQLRERAGLNLPQIAKESPIKEVDRPLLSKIERGIVNPTESIINLYYRVCGLSIQPTQENATERGATALNCKLESNAKVDRLTRYNQILRVLDKPMTAREIAYKLGFHDLNAVRPRLTELTQDGEVEECGTKHDELTDRKVTLYRRAI